MTVPRLAVAIAVVAIVGYFESFFARFYSSDDDGGGGDVDGMSFSAFVITNEAISIAIMAYHEALRQISSVALDL